MFTNFRDFVLLIFAASLMYVLLAITGAIMDAPAVLTAIAMILLMMSGFSMGLLTLYRRPVDIWMHQGRLMKASDQSTPLRPEVNNDVVLYIALTLEELQETVVPINLCLQRNEHHGRLQADLTTLSHQLRAFSSMLRGTLKHEAPFHYHMNFAEAKEALDGVTDDTVTIAGLAIAAGLPVPQGYEQVQLSNYSKRNPETGKIDKLPDGKWKKGPLYQMPRLDELLQPFFQEGQ